MMDKSDFLTVTEASRALKINRFGIYDLIREQKLKAYRFSERRIRIHVDDLNEFIRRAKHISQL